MSSSHFDNSTELPYFKITNLNKPMLRDNNNSVNHTYDITSCMSQQQTMRNSYNHASLSSNNADRSIRSFSSSSHMIPQDGTPGLIQSNNKNNFTRKPISQTEREIFISSPTFEGISTQHKYFSSKN